MSASASVTARKPLRGAWAAILIGGLVAGGLDTIVAYVTLNAGWPRAVAGGLLGMGAFKGGAGVYAFGLFLEFFIATGAAAVYYAFSRRLEFLKPHFFVCGLYFGIAVYLVMNLIVLPLCALHVHSPISRSDLIQGILVHMFLIGLPIAYCARRFSR